MDNNKKKYKDANPETDKRFSTNAYYLLRDRYTIGRKRKFENGQDLMDEAVAYFKRVDENPRKETKVFGSGYKVEIDLPLPYTMSGLYVAIGVDQKMFERYEKADSPRPDGTAITEDDRTLADAARLIRGIIYTQKIEGASVGVFQHQIVALELGLAKKTEATVVNHDSKQMTPDEIKNFNNELEEDY